MIYQNSKTSQKRQLAYLGKKIFPGLFVWLAIILAKSLGLFEILDLKILDLALKYKPEEQQDPFITLVTINDEDISSLNYTNKYPIPDQEIAELIRVLQEYEPSVIGLDLFRDFAIGNGQEELQKVFQDYPNIVGIEKVLGAYPIQPHSNINISGFVDILPDRDGHFRRILLGTPTSQGYKFSFVLHLADQYLTKKGYTLGNGRIDPKALCIYAQYKCLNADREVPRFTRNMGGYTGADDGGLQTMVNFRSGQNPFLKLSLNDIKSGDFREKDIRDRIVIIGVTSLAHKDLIATNALKSAEIQGQIYGVEYVAHAVSQLIHSVESNRPLIWVSESYDYLGLFILGVLSIGLSLYVQLRIIRLSIILLVGLIVSIILNFVFIQFGLWISIIPVWVALILVTGIASLYQSFEKTRLENDLLEKKVTTKQLVIEEVFNYIHNSPLQTLAELIRNIEQNRYSQDQVIAHLNTLNHEIRAVKSFYGSSQVTNTETLFISGVAPIDPSWSLDQIFRQVYFDTINREFENFKNLKARISNFDEITLERVSRNKQKQLCLFLQECLCNVGRHAYGLTRLQVVGYLRQGYYILKIQDNGIGISEENRDKLLSKFHDLQRLLDAVLTIERLQPKGTLCELKWKI